MGMISESILLLCLISVTNANFRPEIISHIVHLCEAIPKDGYAFTINATDEENDPLTYEFTPLSNFFHVNPNNGEVTVKNLLDREISDIFSVRVTVSDPTGSDSKNLTVILGDANDNKPIFTQATYEKQIPENAPIGTTLFKVEANDDDLGVSAQVKYKIEAVIPNDGVSPFTIVQDTGEVILNGTLNYKTLSIFYSLKIVATDGGGGCGNPQPMSSIAFGSVTVEDVPDLDPLFTKLPYVASVEENSALGLTVLKVTAIDQDTGINDEITYDIEDSTQDGLFDIVPNTGEIFVLAEIDRELVGDSVTLTVKATEVTQNIYGYLGNTSATVNINIVDINDNKPEFYASGGSGEVETHFTGEVLEHSLGSIDINMTVKDADMNSKIILTLDGPDKAVFSVEPQLARSESTVQLVVKQPQMLDYEKTTQMVVQVIAVDQENDSFRSTATVTIRIKDDNDNRPKFPQDAYMIKVPEHSPDGTVIETIVAEDPDTMDEGKLIYTLLPESILKYFDVDPNNGSIFVKNSTLLDREVRSLYSATLQATDTDGKPGSTVLDITLTDINDQAPVFNRESYLDFVPEGKQVKLQIEATDRDEPGNENSQIVYKISPSSDYFTIDPNTGMLTNKVDLDREALDPTLDGKILLNVTATDKGVPALTSTVTVTINVQDVNDNAPKFNAGSYKFYVKEGERGAHVGSVEAQDLDQTSDFNRITFSIIDGGFGSFIIRTYADGQGYMGNISVDPGIELDYESDRKNFALKVEAADLEPKVAFVTVEVEVLDVNDERPEFIPTGPLVVLENTTINIAIGNFIAKDKDGNHSLIYSMESLKCRCNGTKWTPCDWFILEPTGEITVNLKETVDYELCDQAVMVAQVVDEFTEKGYNNSIKSGEIVINIEDINDNIPKFIMSDSVFVVVSETASKGTSVAVVMATDADSEKHSKIKFAVNSVLFEDTNGQITDMKGIFISDLASQENGIYRGIIQTTRVLNTELKGKYLVNVSASDADFSTSTVLEIFTVDITFKIELRFTTSKEEVEENRSKIIFALTAATGAAVEIVATDQETPETSRASSDTIMEAYFIYPNGTALSSDSVRTMLSDADHYPILRELGLSYIGDIHEPTSTPPTMLYALLGMVAGFIIVLTVLTTSLVCTRRNYRTKLKAAKALNTAEMMTSDNQKSGAVVPGTNKYTMEGANPVLNLNINSTMMLDIDEESSDVDKVSLNSLDYNDDMAVSEKDSSHIMKMIQEEEDDDQGPPEYIEPLGAALAQRGMKTNPGSSSLAFSNPAFNTTDL